MENEFEKQVDSFEFLNHEDVLTYFANINIDLLQGKHIQMDEYNSFKVLDKYREEFKFYYQKLYQLDLKRDSKNDVYYFYLDFQEDNKGKLYRNDRHKYLTEHQTIIGLMLLNMYYTKLFSPYKEIHWDEIKNEILNGENKIWYQELLFKEFKSGGYTDRQWNEFKNDLSNTIKSFEKLGWIKRIEKGTQTIHFEIRESILRLADLYNEELTNFEAFTEKIKLRNKENGRD